MKRRAVRGEGGALGHGEGRGIPRETRLDLLAGALVLLVCAAGQLWLLLGPHPYDPAYYFELAADFPVAIRDYWALRIGLLAPARVAFAVFGPSEAALYAVPVATALLLAGAVYGTVLALFRNRVLGAAAALVTAFNPNWLLNSSFVFPDTAATATFAAGVLCLVLGRGSAEQERRWVPTAFAVAAGVFFGWAYLIREFSPLLLPAVVAAVVLLRYPGRRVAAIVGGAVAMFLLELLYGLAGFGDPLVRAHVLLDRRDAAIRPARRLFMERLQDEVNDPLDSALIFPRLVLAWDSGWIVLVLLGIFVAGLVCFRDRRLWLLAAWFLSFWAVMVVFGLWRLPTGELIVNVTNIRYWYPIFPPLVMGAFGSLGLFVQRYGPTRRGALATAVSSAALAALALVPGTIDFHGCATKDAWRNEPQGRWDDLRAWLGTSDADRYEIVWTDVNTGRILPAYSSTTFGDSLWEGEVKTVQRRRRLVVPQRDVGRSAIIIHKRFPRANLSELRREWSPVFQSDDGWIVVLAHGTTSGGAGNAGQPWWQLQARGGAADVGECGLSELQAPM